MAKVHVSAVISAPIDRAWATIRNFDGLPGWLPVVRESRMEGGKLADQVGAIRALRMHDGGLVRETLLALSDLEHSLTYDIFEAPMAVVGYHATIQLRPVTDGDQTFFTWAAEFATDPPEAEAETVAFVTGVFRDGVASLKRQFGGR